MSNNKLYDICIIGAGASGLAAAIESSRRGLSCVVVDKNKKAASKLYGTGNGRCNLTNDNWDDDVYYGNTFPFEVFDHIYTLTGKRPRNFIIDYFKDLGISTFNKNGYYYPESMQASSVVWALLDAAKGYGAEIINSFEIFDIDINSKDDIFYYTVFSTETNEEGNRVRINARNILLASGGLSQVKYERTNNNPEVLVRDSLGIKINEFKPGLCPVSVNEDLSSLAGVRVKVRMNSGNKTEVGELQITEKLVSGIITFNMSYYMEPGSKIKISVLPRISTDEFVESFKSIRLKLPEKPLLLFLNGYVNDKLARYFIDNQYGEIGNNIRIKDITETGIRELYDEMTGWTLTVKEKKGFEMSQASIGGIPTHLINPETMKLNGDSPVYKGLYATGEITDVIGKCGGYNLTYAFITGYLAGRSIK